MKAINIKWDTDGNMDLLETLPKEMEIPEGMEDEDEISDWLSDETGFCHNGFTLIEGEIRYYVCGIGYDENNCIAEYDQNFGDFDTYEEAYECFEKLQSKNAATFFEEAPDIYSMILQLEKCDETEDEINCIDIKNEWRILNPNFN